MTTLEEKRKELERMQFSINILKLETRLLEMREEEEKIKDNINVQKQKLEELNK